MKTPTMHYGMISGGAFDAEMQSAFIEAQELGVKHGVATELSCTIVIAPIDEKRGFGGIQYKIGVKRGSKKSAPFQTQINDEGFIAFDSGSMGCVQSPPERQVEMFPESTEAQAPVSKPNTVNFRTGTED